MQVSFSYQQQSVVRQTAGRTSLDLAANTSREPVAFDAALREPLRFREAISALHDVVISNLKFQKRDRTAYREWKAKDLARERDLRNSAYEATRERVLAAQNVPLPVGLEGRFQQLRKRYWHARQQYADFLFRHDRHLWRMLMPCDPIITVAPDALLFECFSADESSYGCLTVDREAGFGPCLGEQQGTTNVDYSWNLYHHFQSLRSYRETRFRIDPGSFEVATRHQQEHREEKIELPQSWLRGFLQLQAAMMLPTRVVTLSREAVYSILAWLKRHKANSSPRAVRFELQDGQPLAVVLEPWEKRIVSYGRAYQGASCEPIRIWGRNRLLTLARLLPLAEQFDVHLLGTGMPSLWVARMGSMQFTLGLSGWTANDWTSASAIDLLAPPASPLPQLVQSARQELQKRRFARPEELAPTAEPAERLAAIHLLARTGQAIFDLTRGAVRWRQILPQSFGEADLGPENAELTAARDLIARRRVRVDAKTELQDASLVIQGSAEGHQVELLIDGDRRIRRGRCECRHDRRGGLRMGPCRHLLAVRMTADQPEPMRTSRDWLERLRQWATT